MSKNYKFYHHSKCEYMPCHTIPKYKEKEFNCIFCYCPLYPYSDCGGVHNILPNGIKDCSKCTIPHFSYDYIINKTIEFNNKE